MNKITLYIGKTILTTILLAMTLFIGLEFIFSLVNELRYVGTGSYTFWQALLFIMLSIPENISEIFPMAALVGTLMGLGLLASRSELIVMRSAGMSMQAIIFAVLKLALILILISWILGECVAPVLDKYAHRQKAVALSGGQALRTVHGTWMREGNDFIHIQSMPETHHLQGITRYQFNTDMVLQKSSYAKEAKYQDGQWILYDINETQFDEHTTSRSHFGTQPWLSHIDPEILNIVNVKDIDELTLIGLWQTIDYRLNNQLDAKPYQLAFWQKIFRPIATLIMMFLAIPFIFGPLRSSTMGLRMLVGVFVGFAFYTFNQLFGPLTLVYSLPPILGASIPLFFFLGLGILLLKRSS